MGHCGCKGQWRNGLSSLCVKGFSDQAGSRHRKPESRRHEGKSKVQADEQETMAKRCMDFPPRALSASQSGEALPSPGQDGATDLTLFILDEVMQPRFLCAFLVVPIPSFRVLQLFQSR